MSTSQQEKRFKNIELAIIELAHSLERIQSGNFDQYLIVEDMMRRLGYQKIKEEEKRYGKRN